MPPLSRDAWIASIAAALGVSPLACGAEPPAADSPVVAAREVTAWSSPSASSSSAPLTFDSGAGADAATTAQPATDAGNPLTYLAPIPPTPPPAALVVFPLGLLAATAVPPAPVTLDLGTIAAPT